MFSVYHLSVRPGAPGLSGEEGPMLWIFDLDHTLVESPLDLGAVKAEIARVLERHRVRSSGPASPAAVAELAQMAADHDRRHGTSLATLVWQIVAHHERQALPGLRPVAGAAVTLEALRQRGDAIAVWTNNARSTAQQALERCGLAPMVDFLVTRDDVHRLKPAPDGFHVLQSRWGAGRVGKGHAGGPDAGSNAPHHLRAGGGSPAVMVGDSWIDGAAAAAAGLPFVAFRSPAEVWASRGIPVWLRIDDLRELLAVPVPGPGPAGEGTFSPPG